MDFSKLITPGVEQVLSAIPQLLGAWEQGRGRPIGGVLQMLGGFGNQHAQMRRDTGDANALQSLAQGFNQQQTPIAYGEYQKLLPQLDQMSPGMQISELQNVRQVGEREQLKTPRQPQKFFNQQTGGSEFHSPEEFQNGAVPKNLIPWGPVADKLYSKAMGIPPTAGKPTDAAQMWDNAARAKFGQSFADLSKSNPAAAYAIQEHVKTIGADESFNNAAALIPMHMEAAMQQFLKEQAVTPKDNFDRAVKRDFGYTPEQYENLDSKSKADIHSKVIAQEAADQAIKTRASADERAKAGSNLAMQKWLDTPVMGKSGLFAVNPKTYHMVTDPRLTVGGLDAAGLRGVSRNFQQAFEQGAGGIDGLDQMAEAGRAILPASGGTTYSTDAYLAFQDKRGDKNARVFRANRLNLIRVLRNLAGTSRPNQKELDLAVDSLTNVSNQQQLDGAIGVAKHALKSTMDNLMGVSDSVVKNRTKLMKDGAAISALGGGSPAEAPDPGFHASY